MSISGNDVKRMGEAVSHPGIDPRTWLTLAVVDAVNVTDHGVYADITTITGNKECAVVAPLYAGPGFGLYTPIYVGAFVVVAHPEGEGNTGGRIIAMTWDKGEPPPPEVMDAPADILLVAQPESNVRIITKGGGNVVLEVRDGGKVLLGGPDADRGVARIDDDVLIGDTTLSALQTQLDLRYVLNSGTPPPPIFPAGDTVKAKISSASSDVLSK